MEPMNTMALRWNHYAWPQDKPLDLARLREVERAWGISFPPDYVDCIREHQGKTPEPAGFETVDGTQTSLNDLYHFEPSPSDSNIVKSQEAMQRGGVPEGLFVFASDPAGNCICFDYRRSASAPSVVLLDYERDAENAVVPVADSFTALLDKLH